MENKDQPAFAAMSSSNGIRHKQEGLTKRELIAAMAMQGWLSSWPENNWLADHEKLAEVSVQIADELLKELQSKP